MKARVILLLLASASLLGVLLMCGQANSAALDDTPSTSQRKVSTRPKEEHTGPLVAKDGQGNTTVYGRHVTKQTDPDGKVLQWYQFFADADGKCVITIARAGLADDLPANDGIQLISYHIYRPDGNIAEKYDFLGSGPIQKHVIYRYGSDGKYLKGDIYDEKGKQIGSELTKPEVFMYGDKRKSQE